MSFFSFYRRAGHGQFNGLFEASGLFNKEINAIAKDVSPLSTETNTATNKQVQGMDQVGPAMSHFHINHDFLRFKEY